MKLTDLLKKYWNTLDEDVIDEIATVLPSEILPASFETEDEIKELIDILDNNFSNIDYTDQYSLLDFISDLSEIVSDEEELEDMDKQILRREFVFLIDGDYWKLEFQTGYYNFPLSNEIKKVQKKIRTIEYYD
jgi:hypothetical protein